MYLRIKILSRLFVFYSKKMFLTYGLNSKLEDGNHIIMFDFDECPITTVLRELVGARDRFELADIYVLNTGKKDHWHAYCLMRMDFRSVTRIIMSCEHIDLTFVRFGLWRKHYTLRVYQKNGRDIKGVIAVKGLVDSNVNFNELKSFTKYETATG